jgi:hypothetical protein
MEVTYGYENMVSTYQNTYWHNLEYDIPVPWESNIKSIIQSYQYIRT